MAAPCRFVSISVAFNRFGLDLLATRSIFATKSCRSWSRYNKVLYRSLSSSPSADNDLDVVPRIVGLPTVSNVKSEKVLRVSKAMKAYLERARQHDEFIKDQQTDYEIGRRHLANMMGEDPETFTQKDVDRSLQYLMPSGLFEPKARPVMKPPEDLFAKRKAAEFDIFGRPFHYMFYTLRPNFYQLMHDIGCKYEELNAHQDAMYKVGIRELPEPLNLSGSDWISKDEFEKRIVEKLKENHYAMFLKTLEVLGQHPYAIKEKEFLMQFRNILQPKALMEPVPLAIEEGNGIRSMMVTAKRKRAIAVVTVRVPGTGVVQINGEDINYFKLQQDKEQIMFPLQFSDMLFKCDVTAEAREGGPSGQSGAIRLGIAMALRSFLDHDKIERMRLAGLLQYDFRTSERKKYGQKGARAKFTWKKR